MREFHTQRVKDWTPSTSSLRRAVEEMRILNEMRICSQAATTWWLVLKYNLWFLLKWLYLSTKIWCTAALYCPCSVSYIQESRRKLLLVIGSYRSLFCVLWSGRGVRAEHIWRWYHQTALQVSCGYQVIALTTTAAAADDDYYYYYEDYGNNDAWSIILCHGVFTTRQQLFSCD